MAAAASRTGPTVLLRAATSTRLWQCCCREVLIVAVLQVGFEGEDGARSERRRAILAWRCLRGDSDTEQRRQRGREARAATTAASTGLRSRPFGAWRWWFSGSCGGGLKGCRCDEGGYGGGWVLVMDDGLGEVGDWRFDWNYDLIQEHLILIV